MNARQRGFTLLEVMVVMALFAPVLGMVLMSTSVVSRSVDADDRSAEVLEAARRAAERIGRLVRPAKLSTIRVRATPADVAAGLATTVGQWIAPVDLDPRPSIRFQAAEGLLAMNINLSTTPREIDFVMDADETANGVDDDGDGLVDEGKVRLLYESSRLFLADGVESCSFMMEGRLLHVTLHIARRDKSGTVYRAAVEEVLYVRNN